jgi:hypothetical protein
MPNVWERAPVDLLEDGVVLKLMQNHFKKLLRGLEVVGDFTARVKASSDSALIAPRYPGGWCASPQWDGTHSPAGFAVSLFRFPRLFGFIRRGWRADAVMSLQ